MNIPDLNEFCEPFGGLGNMTAERWKEWEELNKRYERYVQEQEQKLRVDNFASRK
jgi:hypothetical protein